MRRWQLSSLVLLALATAASGRMLQTLLAARAAQANPSDIIGGVLAGLLLAAALTGLARVMLRSALAGPTNESRR